MKSNLTIEERGIFWLADVNLEINQFAPDNAVHGTYKQFNDGSAEIELDSLFNNSRSKSMNTDYECKIAGLLKNNKYVFLVGAHSWGLALRSSNLDTENFRSNICLYGNMHIERIKQLTQSVHAAAFPLGKFQSWLNLYPIEVTKTDETISISSPLSSEIKYKRQNFALILNNFIADPWLKKTTEEKVCLRVQSEFVFDFFKPVSLDFIAQKHRRMQELLILLSNQEANLDWPIIRDTDCSQSVTMYYWRTGDFNADYEPQNTWICYSELEPIFGDIVEKWLQIIERVGSGYYLYLSIRRGLFHYSESKFISLVSGIEALHRHNEQTIAAQPVSLKMEVIFDFIRGTEGLKSSHKRWLLRKLRHAGEPNLADRIFNIISDLPVRLDGNFLRRFSRECQDRRNSIAHFGRVDRHNDSPNSYNKLSILTAILEHLYHIRILKDIGVPDKILDGLKENVRKNLSLNFYVSRCSKIFAEEDERNA